VTPSRRARQRSRVSRSPGPARRHPKPAHRAAAVDGEIQLRPREPNQGVTAKPSGPVTAELLFDPPGHVRLPITDDEIIARALSVVPLAARPVTVITYDTGMASALARQGSTW
jgi:hypothetical protein